MNKLWKWLTTYKSVPVASQVKKNDPFGDALTGGLLLVVGLGVFVYVGGAFGIWVYHFSQEQWQSVLPKTDKPKKEAAVRFAELVKSGNSKDEAYKTMVEEGY